MKPVRVLVVDDRIENITAMQAVLADCGYEVFEAESGKQALLLAEQHDFAVILLDVQMPIMDGFETARRLREMERSRCTPIVFVTAIHRTEAYEELGYIAGAVDFLFKPFNPTILQAKVAVFAELRRKTEAMRQHTELLHAAALKEQENAMLKESLARRDEFLSIASHELKTPITPLNLQVQSFLQMVRSGTLNNLPPERLERMLVTSQNQIDRLARLVDELIDISRLKSDRLELKRAPASLKALVQGVIEQFAPEFKKNGCEVTLQTDGEGFGVMDSFRIEQIIINLLLNAVKYGNGCPITVRLRDDGRQAQLSVEDGGIGIAEDDLQRIFQRFERAVSAKNYGGLGLGLFICSRIAELHGGRISVTSKLGEGSTFTLHLPLKEEALLHSQFI
ncbi:MAG: hybrid sensor histidine kinase/response regulator [Bdellovibrionales bacterium]|nr:hybrid sensor histidine kinase/response regulator [Bdellovibrionales bacterium]